MARTYRTLSLSLPPGAVDKLSRMGEASKRTGARVAAEIVLRAIAEPTGPTARRNSWCCDTTVVPVQGPLVVVDQASGAHREWFPVIALLCGSCRRQMHGSEYEGWLVT